MNKLRLTGLLLTRLLGLLLMCVSCVQVGYAQQSGGGNYPTGNGVRVREVDGSPNVPGTQTLVFPNGSLTRAGQTVTVTFASSGTFSTPVIITSTSNPCFAVGPNGSTNPSLSVDCSPASAATGVKVTPAAAGSGVTIGVTSSGANENLLLGAKGSGYVGTSGSFYFNSSVGYYLSDGVNGFFNGGGTKFTSTGGVVWVSGANANLTGDTGIVRGGAGIVRGTNASTGAAQLLLGTSTDTADAQLSVYSASSTRPGLKLSALTGTGASQQVLQSYNAAGATLTYAVRADGVEFQNGVTFANLPGTPSNGMYLYCSDCTVTSGADNTATSGGSGAFVVRLNGVWRAFATQN